MQRFQDDYSSLMARDYYFSRYERAKQSNYMIKQPWSPQEDRLLASLVEQHGLKSWSHIASMLAGRIGKQCRERWYNHLRPNIKKEAWTEEEEEELIKAHEDLGNKWAEIAKRIPGRTENAIKNHWNATKRMKLSKRKYQKLSGNSKRPSSVLQEYMSNRFLGMEEGIKTENKKLKEAKEVFTASTPLPSSVNQEDFHAIESNYAEEQNHGIIEGIDISHLFAWPSSSSALRYGLEDQNPSLKIQEFPTMYEKVKREMGLEDLVSSSMNMSY